MTDESGFLPALLAEPANDNLRLIYADWLDERCDPVAAAKAEFLRLTVQGPDLPVAPNLQTEEALKQRRRLRELAAELDKEWLAVTSRLPIENCPTKRAERVRRSAHRVPFQFLCEQRWQELRATEEAIVRFCDQCQEQVHYCGTIDEARVHARAGRCVAIDLEVVRRNEDLGLMSPRMLLGKLVPLRRQEDSQTAVPPSSPSQERRGGGGDQAEGG